MPYTYREISKKLEKLGFVILRRGKGSHVVFGKDDIRIIVPRHGGKDISPGVEKKIIKLVELSPEDFRSI